MPVFSCAHCQTANDTKRLRCVKCQALLSRLTIGQVFQGRFLPIQLLETDASVLTYAIEIDEDRVPAVLREYFPPQPITRELLRGLDRVAGALVEGKHLGLHPLTEYFAVEGCFYTIEDPPPSKRLSAQLLSGPLSPEAGGKLLGQLTLLILGLSASEPPLYHGALTPSAIALADAEGPPVLVSPRVLADVIDSGNLPGPRDALNRDLRAAALVVLHGVSGRETEELATNPAVRRSIIDDKFQKSSDGPVLDWLAGGGPPPQSGRVLLDFHDAVVKGCASMARGRSEDAERAWQNALLHYRCPMVESWIGVARQPLTPALPAPALTDWRCPYCRCLNFPDSLFCGRCGTKRGELEPKNRPAHAPAPKPVVVAATPQPAPQILTAKDWRCQYCQIVNFPDSAFCGKCGTKRGEKTPQRQKHLVAMLSTGPDAAAPRFQKTQAPAVIHQHAVNVSQDPAFEVTPASGTRELGWTVAIFIGLVVLIIIWAIVQASTQGTR